MLVVIPTTERPVQLQRIIAEEPGIRSVICLDGSTEEVPISRDYHAFVKRPTGIIEADFGHSAYRIDVSASIDAGKSWHFPVYLAHCLFSQSGSVTEPAPTDTEQVDLIWASGEINHDRVVLPVEGIESKVQASRELIVDSLDRGARVLMLVAESNEGQLRHALERLNLSEHPSIRVHSVHKVSINTLAPFLGNEDSPADSDLVEALEDKCEPDSTVSRGRTALLSRILLLFALLGASSAVLALYQTTPLMQLWRSGDLQGLNQALEGSALWKRKLFNALAGMERIQQGDLSVTLQKIAPPAELSCLSATEVQALEPNIVNLWSGAPISGPPHLETTEYGLMQLCEVVYTVHNNSDRPLYINFVLGTADENGEGISAGQLLEPKAQLDVSYSVKFYDSQLSYKHVWQLVAAPYDLRQLPRSQIALLGGWFGGLFIEGEHIFRHSVEEGEGVNRLQTKDDKNKVQGSTADLSRFN